jgi:hypothetical protein
VETVEELGHSVAAYRPHFIGMHGLPFLINLGIEGYQHEAEALKFYEMSYFARGHILELGTHKGLPTSILAHAPHDFKLLDAKAAMDDLIAASRKFAFIFIDH